MVKYCRSDISKHPRCAHGPTLLFSHKRKDDGRKFYACSAYRDRKQCSFFMWADEKVIPGKKVHYKTEKNQLNVNEINLIDRLKEEPADKRYYCYTCDNLFIIENKSEHDGHLLEEFVSDIQLLNPSLLLKAKESSKGESQYYFSLNTTKTICSFFRQLNVSDVLCVGCPKLHEYITNDLPKTEPLHSMLLDIDSRYCQFYKRNQFQQFNMFNCHMFRKDGWHVVREFFQSSNIAIVIDPPFSGRIEPLVHTFNQLTSVYRECNISSSGESEIPIMLILPYFMERVVKEYLPEFNMLDYKVEYINHPTFKAAEQGGRKQGSPVRIFTNVNLSRFKLPRSESYKFCKICNKWVSKENEHCAKCNFCTSKNGGTYKHCDCCDKCVKITWEHCEKCQHCALPEHFCNTVTSSPVPMIDNEPVITTQKSKRKRTIKRWNRIKGMKRKKCDS